MKPNSPLSFADPAPGHGGKYLTLTLAGESYALPVLKVREIIRLPKITPVAQVPEHIRGVTNLRGQVIPVIDLRLRFGLAAGITERTCVVVVHVKLADRERPMGLVVDAVDEVTMVSEAMIQPPPELGGSVRTDYLLGVAKVNEGVKLLLDVERIVEDRILEATVSRAA